MPACREARDDLTEELIQLAAAATTTALAERGSSQQLLQLAAQQVLVLTMAGLAAALLPCASSSNVRVFLDRFRVQLQQAGPRRRDSRLRAFAEELLSQVPWTQLQAALLTRSSSGHLVTEKLQTLVLQLRASRQAAPSSGGDGGWAAMVSQHMHPVNAAVMVCTILPHVFTACPMS
jgi:hypothetical protein